MKASNGGSSDDDDDFIFDAWVPFGFVSRVGCSKNKNMIFDYVHHRTAGSSQIDYVPLSSYYLFIWMQGEENARWRWRWCNQPVKTITNEVYYTHWLFAGKIEISRKLFFFSELGSLLKCKSAVIWQGVPRVKKNRFQPHFAHIPFIVGTFWRGNNSIKCLNFVETFEIIPMLRRCASGKIPDKESESRRASERERAKRTV